MTNITASILVCGASCTAAYTVDILIALAAMFRKVYTRAEHSTDICMAFVEAFLNNSVDEWTAME
jgi:hypothetical protein